MSHYQVHSQIGDHIRVYDPNQDRVVTAIVASVEVRSFSPVKYWLEFKEGFWLDYKYDGKHWSRH